MINWLIEKVVERLVASLSDYDIHSLLREEVVKRVDYVERSSRYERLLASETAHKLAEKVFNNETKRALAEDITQIINNNQLNKG